MGLQLEQIFIFLLQKECTIKLLMLRVITRVTFWVDLPDKHLPWVFFMIRLLG